MNLKNSFRYHFKTGLTLQGKDMKTQRNLHGLRLAGCVLVASLAACGGGGGSSGNSSGSPSPSVSTPASTTPTDNAALASYLNGLSQISAAQRSTWSSILTSGLNQSQALAAIGGTAGSNLLNGNLTTYLMGDCNVINDVTYNTTCSNAGYEVGAATGTGTISGLSAITSSAGSYALVNTQNTDNGQGTASYVAFGQPIEFSATDPEGETGYTYYAINFNLFLLGPAYVNGSTTPAYTSLSQITGTLNVAVSSSGVVTKTCKSFTSTGGITTAGGWTPTLPSVDWSDITGTNLHLTAYSNPSYTQWVLDSETAQIPAYTMVESYNAYFQNPNDTSCSSLP